jgi:hypothetical protein
MWSPCCLCIRLSVHAWVSIVDSEETDVAEQRHDRYLPVATNEHAAIEEPMDMVFSVLSMACGVIINLQWKESRRLVLPGRVNRAAWLLESKDNNVIRSWVPRESEPRMTVLARTSSSLPDRFLSYLCRLPACWKTPLLGGSGFMFRVSFPCAGFLPWQTNPL